MFELFFRVACAALFYVCSLASAIAGFGVAAVAAMVTLFFLVLPAAAASIDLSPVVELAFAFANELIVGLLILFGGYLVALLKKKTGIDLAIAQQGDNRMFHDGIQRGVDAAERKLRDLVVRNQQLVLTVDSPIVASMADRMLRASPDLLKRLGITRADLKKRVLEHVEARLARLV